MKPNNFDAMYDNLPVDDKIGDQIMPWKTKEFACGYAARVNRKPFDKFESKEWQEGWWYADSNSMIQMID